MIFVAGMFVWFSLLGVSCVICVAGMFVRFSLLGVSYVFFVDGSLVCGFRCSEFCCVISLLGVVCV